MCCYAMEPEHSNPPRVLARERKRRQRANASAESLSTPACRSGNEPTPAAADSTATDLREAFYCAFLRNTSHIESTQYTHLQPQLDTSTKVTSIRLQQITKGINTHRVLSSDPVYTV